MPHIRMAAKSKAALHEKSHGSMVKHFVDKQIFPLSTTHIELRPGGNRDLKFCNYEIPSLPMLQDYDKIIFFGPCTLPADLFGGSACFMK